MQSRVSKPDKHEMIDREQFAKALEEIRDLRALLAFERFSYDQLAAKVERDGAGVTAIASLKAPA